MCLVVECCIGFFVKFITLVLSQSNGIFESVKLKVSPASYYAMILN